MNLLKNALTRVRIIHAAFVSSWFLFLFATWQVSPVARGVSLTLIQALILAALTDVALAVYFRSQYITLPVEVLRQQPSDTKALEKWRAGNLLSFTFAETITLLGLALKFLGAEWKIAGAFFSVGLVLLLLWFPRLDLIESGFQ